MKTVEVFLTQMINTVLKLLKLINFNSCSHFSTVDAVLHGAHHMVAMQTASDPTVRQVLRRAFRKRAILSVRPTKKGKKVSKCYNKF